MERPLSATNPLGHVNVVHFQPEIFPTLGERGWAVASSIKKRRPKRQNQRVKRNRHIRGQVYCEPVPGPMLIYFRDHNASYINWGMFAYVGLFC